ncbi:alpha-1,3-glucosidase [Aureococcus anophagefferens]|nr:alpha-1,3-glucosidase [Aureococcus anophagefferens]
MVMFSDDDDEWHAERVATYARAAARVVLVSPRYGVNDGAELKVVASPPGSLPSNYWDLALPSALLRRFVAETDPREYASPFADCAFLEWLLKTGAFATARRVEPRDGCWMYLWRQDHAQRPQHAARLNAELAEEVGEGLAGRRRSPRRSWFAAAYEAGMGRRVDAARIPVDALVGAYRDRVLAAERDVELGRIALFHGRWRTHAYVAVDADAVAAAFAPRATVPGVNVAWLKKPSILLPSDSSSMKQNSARHIRAFACIAGVAGVRIMRLSFFFACVVSARMEEAAGARGFTAASAPSWPELLPYDPRADPAAVVVSGSFRCTVLTDRLLRFEYAKSGAFEDRATTAFVHRPAAVHKASSANGTLTVRTKSLVVTWDERGEDLSSLAVAPAPGADSGRLALGASGPGNLLGTIRSLDELGPTPLNCTVNKNITVHDEGLHCAWGLVSRSGWAAVDDAETFALDGDGWWRGPNRDDEDVMLFAHGFDYKGALKDFIRSRAARRCRAALGAWWAVPAWGGYTWDANLFPDPADAVRGYLKDEAGLVVLANVHDDDGVVASEDRHAAVVAAMGLPETTGDVPFELCNNSAYAWRRGVLLPLEAQGIDYWWIDWQQGGALGGCAGDRQNPTIWTARLRSTDHARRGSTKRGLVLSRWGGLGSHRYPVGFSGDVATVDWHTLAYQPYFSATAANVAYGFWSHDVVSPGFEDGASTDALEVYTRWVQWTAYSGVVRSHDRGLSAGDCDETFPATRTSDACGVVEPWGVPAKPYFAAIRAALKRRGRCGRASARSTASRSSATTRAARGRRGRGAALGAERLARRAEVKATQDPGARTAHVLALLDV